MGKNETRRLSPAVLADDREIFTNLQAIEDYHPANAAYTVAALTIIDNEEKSTGALEIQALAAYEAARDNHIAKQWAMHNGLLGAKDQVVAQFGINSNEAQSLGLKKKTEYKSPKRKKAAAGGSSTT
jgi:hypothetical protein